MRSLLVTAPASGHGKTTITLGLIRALKARGLDICSYKAGPDYIDRAFLEKASGLPTGNLDLHLQGTEGMFYSLSRAPAEMCVIEGVMGFFDGIANTFKNSCYDITRRLAVPSLLVYTPKGEMFSAIPKIKGMAEFEDSTIKAVLFNNVSERYFHLLKAALEDYSDLVVVGYVPPIKNAEFGSRHLGLIQSQEIEDLEIKIDLVADEIAKTVDLGLVESLLSEVLMPESITDFSLAKVQTKVGIARDKAFSFYYRENLELLENSANVVYFSPLEDPAIPECDLLYFGGGYPEVFRNELAGNTSMLKSIKDFGEKGGYIFGECGGLMYLAEYIEDRKMVGLLPGKCTLTDSLQRFGYIDLVLEEDCFLGKAGTQFTGHEFHKSVAIIDCPPVFAISKTLGDAKWSCGFKKDNIIAGYPHISFLSNIKILSNMLAEAGNS